MLFSEPAFLFFFLPAVLLLYFGLGRRFQDLVLLGFSLLFYSWGEHAYVVILLLSIALNWLCGLVAGADGRFKKQSLIAAIVGNLLLLIGFKYSNFLVDNLNVLLARLALPTIRLGKVHLPIGISFFAFQGMSYVVDVYRGTVPAQRNLIKMAMYKSFFPQLIAGPIVRYVDVKAQIENRSVRLDDFAEGARRFIVGLGKKMIIANIIARPTDQIFALPASQLSGSLAWIAVVGYALQIYFDFSAYSDMAIGLGRMFGFRFLENFNYPYIATSITEFWRRWHISLSTWFRDYLYIPLGGNKVSPFKRYRNLMIVFALCGLWHGASWNFAIWGLFHGAFLVIERLLGVQAPVPAARPQAGAAAVGVAPFAGAAPPPRPLLGQALRHAYMVLVVLVGWVFFRADTLTSALSMLRAMAGFAHPASAVPGVRMFVDASVVCAAAVGVVGSTPLLPVARRWLEVRVARAGGVGTPLELARVVGLVGVLASSVALMAAGSYSPFIYFRF